MSQPDRAPPRAAMRGPRARPWAVALGLAPGLAVLLLCFGIPLAHALLNSVGLGADAAAPGGAIDLSAYAEVLERPALRQAVWATLYLALAPLPLSLAMALPLALLLRRQAWGRRWFEAASRLPVAMPSVIAALMVIVLLERGGFVDRLLHPLGLALPRLLRDPWGLGVLLTTAWKQAPFMAMVIGAALTSLPEDVVDAARTLGAGRWRALWHVELPLAMPGISAAVLLSFIGGMGAFAIPDLVGPPSPRPLAVHMVEEFGNGRLMLVEAMGLLVCFGALAVLAGHGLLVRWAGRRPPRGDEHGA